MKPIHHALSIAALTLLAAMTPVVEEPDRAALEREFQEMLSGVQLVGSFTETGAPADQLPRRENYTINRVSKLESGWWLFDARVQYGERDVTVPITLEVKWAGDTPVITLTDLTIPGLGTYTARVLFYRGQYAGTWSAGDHGGQMFGEIVKIEDETEGDDDGQDDSDGDRDGR